MKALILSIGTRGDMEPFLAMAELLRSRGLQVVCGMPEQFRVMAESRNIPFRPFDRRFIDLIDSEDGHRIMGQQGSFFQRLAAFIRIARKSLSLQGDMIREQYQYVKAESPDLIIYHGKCIYPVIWGIHNPNKTIQMSAMPCMVHTVRDYPNIGMRINLGPRFNKWTYRFVNGVLASTVRRMCKYVPAEEIDKKKLSKRQIKDFLLNQQPYFYSFSPSVFKRPDHWPKHVMISGFRELEKAKTYEPPQALTDFLDEHKKVLFISFGSMVNNNPEGKTEAILDLLQKHDIPAILNTSWGGLRQPEKAYENTLFVDNVPYDWLFPKVYAVIHHGGSGTTHTGLKFGCPTLVVPHIVDQFFWGKTVYDLGVGPKSLPIKKLDEERLESLLIDLWLNDQYKDKAQLIARKMVTEDFADEIMKRIEALIPDRSL